MLCCAVLCCAVLCCAVLCYAVPWCAGSWRLTGCRWMRTCSAWSCPQPSRRAGCSIPGHPAFLVPLLVFLFKGAGPRRGWCGRQGSVRLWCEPAAALASPLPPLRLCPSAGAHLPPSLCPFFPQELTVDRDKSSLFLVARALHQLQQQWGTIPHLKGKGDSAAAGGQGRCPAVTAGTTAPGACVRQELARRLHLATPSPGC